MVVSSSFDMKLSHKLRTNYNIFISNYEDDTEFERLYDSVYGEYKDMGVFRTGILKNLFFLITLNLRL